MPRHSTGGNPRSRISDFGRKLNFLQTTARNRSPAATWAGGHARHCLVQAVRLDRNDQVMSVLHRLAGPNPGIGH